MTTMMHGEITYFVNIFDMKAFGHSKLIEFMSAFGPASGHNKLIELISASGHNKLIKLITAFCHKELIAHQRPCRPPQAHQAHQPPQSSHCDGKLCQFYASVYCCIHMTFVSF
jgi:hypothetical protein